MVITKDYLAEIETVFQFNEKRSFCQIATVAKTHSFCEPKMRTVLLYYEQTRNAFRFTCSTQTHKWTELKTIPKVTGLYFDRDNATQYRFEADATLIDSSSVAEKQFYKATWQMLRPDLRHILWQEYLGDKEKPYDVNEVFPHHGNVLLTPYYWDIFKVGRDDFAKSNRTQMILNNGKWQVYTNAPRICPLDLINNANFD